MLPTFPKIVALRRETNVARTKAMVRQIAPQFGMIGNNVQFEGRAHSIQRADASVDHTEMEKVSAEIHVTRGSALRDFTLDVVNTYLTCAARQMAEGMSRHFYAVLDRGTREAGMVVEAKGGPLTEELLLEMIEKMEHTFKEDGSWNPPTILASHETAAKLKAVEESPESKVKLSELLDRKRDEYRRRQASRVLAG